MEGESSVNRRIVAGMLAVLAVVALYGATDVVALSPISAPAAAAGTPGVNDYPDQDAVDCSALHGIYSWCKNGNWLSPRGFAYRNCTDFAAYRIGITWGSLAFPNSDGNARGWKQGAINSGYQTGSVATPGAVAWYWNGSSTSFGHVGVVLSVNSDGSSTVEQYNVAGTGVYSLTYNQRPNAYLYIHVNPPGGSVLADGTFVSNSNNDVFVIAGGAPVYVSSWTAFGGSQPTTALSDAQFAALAQYPRDGAYIRAVQSGEIYKIVGGAPVYVDSSYWSTFNPAPPITNVDQYAVDHAGAGGVLDHLSYFPADGTFIDTAPPPTGRNEIYKIVGGAPVYVDINYWNSLSPAPPVVGIGQYPVDNAGGAGAMSHLRYFPADGTFIGTTAGYVFRFAGGAPLYVQSWSAVGGPQPAIGIGQSVVDNADAAAPWSHVHRYPANGTFLATSQNTYRVAGGAAFLVSDWAAFGGQQPATLVDQWDVDNPSDPRAHLAASPMDGTTVTGLPSGQQWSFKAGCRTGASGASGSVAVNDSAAAAFATCTPPDTSPPVASPTRSPAANPSGWNNGAVTVNWNWSDGGSGVNPANCTTASTSSGQGNPITLTATCRDRAGNTGTASYQVRVDSTPPVAAITAPNATFAVSQSILVSWAAADGGGSGVATTDVRAARVPATGGAMSAWSLWRSATTVRSGTLVGALGYRYCFSVRARDRAGNIGAWSAPRCVNFPLDDRALAAKTSGWSRGVARGWLAGTYTSGVRPGAAVATTTSRWVRQVGIIATRCATCGTVAVYVGSTRVGIISLYHPTTLSRSLLLLPRFAVRGAGVVRLVIMSSRKLVRIDALALTGF